MLLALSLSVSTIAALLKLIIFIEENRENRRISRAVWEIVQAVLIMLPETFIHDVQTPTDVQNMNKQLGGYLMEI